jgi:hypothetical protein
MMTHNFNTPHRAQGESDDDDIVVVEGGSYTYAHLMQVRPLCTQISRWQ